MSYLVPAGRRVKPCRYRNWTKRERGVLTNGCGGKGGWANPPELRFGASCDHHDANYWIGGNGSDRLRADLQFYREMKKDARRAPWYRRPLAYLAAWTYFRAVRRFGRPYFVPRAAMTDLWTELELAMEGAGHHNADVTEGAD